MNIHFSVSFDWEGHLHIHELEMKHEDDFLVLYDNTSKIYRGPMFSTYNDLLDWLYTFTTVHEAW